VDIAIHDSAAGLGGRAVDEPVDNDVVVVGGGHNGLVCAAYLVRAGLSVRVVEARATVGGCAGSDAEAGARFNLCNCDHSLLRTLPLIDELALADHGLRYLELDPGQVALGWDAAGPLPLFRDVERTIEALAVHFPHQVDGYRRYAADAVPMARLVLDLAAEVPGAGAVLGRAARSGGAAGRLLRWSRRSVGDVLRSYFDDDGLLGPAMAGGAAVWGLASDTPGTGLGALAYAFKHVAPVGRPEGGSGALTEALAARIRAGGGRIDTSTRVTGVRCDGTRVRAVTVDPTGRAAGSGPGADGGAAVTITASAVVVACDPRRVLVDFLRDPPPAAASMIDRWRVRPETAGYESKIDAVIDRLPVWRPRPGDDRLAAVGFDDRLSPSTIVAPGLDDIDRSHRLMVDGRVGSRPMLFVNVPSVLDPSVAPPGRHVLSLEVLFTPYELAGGWAGSGEPDRWLELAADLFEPGLLESIEYRRVMSPPVYERELGLPRGHAASYGGGPVAALAGRDRELSRYRTSVPGLFLTGAATYPGAGVWGASGRNAAGVVVSHLQR
jgi:phytoene dehydrogenase-like protein